MPEKLEKVLHDNNVTEHIYRTTAFVITLLFFVLVFSIVKRSFGDSIDPEKHVYFEIVLLLLLAILAEVAVFYLKIQSVIVLMVLGMLISPSFLDLTWEFLHSIGITAASHAPEIFMHEEIIHIFAQLGAIILLFKVGMHSKIEKIFSKENLLVALAGVLIPFFAGYAYAVIIGSNFAYSMFIGAALAATSVGVTVAILKELKVLDKKFSEIIIGAAVLDDILGLLLLSVVVNITGVSGDVLRSVATTFFTSVLFILGAIVTGRYFLMYFDKKELSEKRFLLALAFMLLLAYLAEVIRLSAIVGAFLAGVILNKSRHYHSLEEKTYGLEYLFMPIFFISLGILVEIKAIALFFMPILAITLIAVLSKVIGCGGMALAAKLNFKESIIVGVGMVPRGEVALIIAAIGLSQGVLSTKEYSILSAMALLTSFLVPSILSFLIRRYGTTD